jgi:hypothetical protein
MTNKDDIHETNQPFQGQKALGTFIPPKAEGSYLHEFKPGELGSGELSPLPSRAMRRIARRSKSSSRGGVVVQLPSWSRPRIVYFESKLEQRVLFLLLARRDLIDLWEQPPSITYFDLDGFRRVHHPDFWVHLSSGRRLLIAVKPAKIVEEQKFVKKLTCVRSAMGKDYADDLLLITDQDFSKAEALNAERFYEFSRSKNERAFERLCELIPSMSFPTTIAVLMEALQFGDQSFRTIVIAIYEGLLSVDKTELIDTSSLIYRGAVQ